MTGLVKHFPSDCRDKYACPEYLFFRILWNECLGIVKCSIFSKTCLHISRSIFVTNEKKKVNYFLKSFSKSPIQKSLFKFSWKCWLVRHRRHVLCAIVRVLRCSDEGAILKQIKDQRSSITVVRKYLSNVVLTLSGQARLGVRSVRFANRSFTPTGCTMLFQSALATTAWPEE